MIRKIIKIDESKCNGCGACASACHEGAIDMVNGKAKLAREDYCDGLGDCLPACPTDAITFEEREAPAYNEAAVLAAKHKAATAARHKAATGALVGGIPAGANALGGCPGSRARSLAQEGAPAGEAGAGPATNGASNGSRLSQWPVQIRLAPPTAPWFAGARLLVAADCTAFAHGNFHNEFIAGRVTLIGCPKLDAVDYAEKLGAIIAGNDIADITVARMEVPCCGGLEMAVQRAVAASGKAVPVRVVTIAVDGRVLVA